MTPQYILKDIVQSIDLSEIKYPTPDSSQQSNMKNLGIALTASLGISEYRVSEAMNAVIKRADEALYRAKNRGRNRLEIS